MADSTLLSRASLVREALVSAAINATFSAAFVMLVFGRMSLVPLRGAGGLVGDSLPQSFAITFMASVVPTLLLNRKSGHALGVTKAIVLRSIAAATVVAAIAIAAHWLLLPVGSVAFRAAFVAKILYGATLGATVTTLTLASWSKRVQAASSGQ